MSVAAEYGTTLSALLVGLEMEADCNPLMFTRQYESWVGSFALQARLVQTYRRALHVSCPPLLR
jgi:hypothetical protein